MHRIYRLQQRLSITGIEATAVLVLCGALALGLTIRQFQGQAAAPAVELLAATDALWAEADSLARISDGPAAERRFVTQIVPADSVLIPTSGYTNAPTHRRTRSGANNPVRMNLNTADAAMLQRLPGIGPALAGRIIAYRQDIGAFTSVRQVVNVRGIGEKTLEKISEWLYIE